jgi:hypothetical protein
MKLSELIAQLQEVESKCGNNVLVYLDSFWFKDEVQGVVGFISIEKEKFCIDLVESDALKGVVNNELA